MIDTHPSCGAGSCAACRSALGLDAVKREETWYCSPTCAQGLPASQKRTAAIPEARLYHSPRRFFRKRAPRELRSAPSVS